MKKDIMIRRRTASCRICLDGVSAEQLYKLELINMICRWEESCTNNHRVVVKKERMAMSRWVTFYRHIMMNGVSDLEIHRNKEDATERFKCLCKEYFHVYGNDVDNAKLPATFGLGFRYVSGMSYPSFKKKMMADYNLSEDEFKEKTKVSKNA